MLVRIGGLFSTAAMAAMTAVSPGAAGQQPAPETMTLAGTGIEMVLLPGGEAIMGAEEGRGDELPRHTVHLDSFWIGRYEITQEQWEAVMGTNPSRFRNCPRCPVDSVTWQEGRDFLQKASSVTGLDLRYPTEAEWEFAAGGGAAHQRWPGTDSLAEVAEFSWFSGSFAGRTKIAGTRLPNAYGLHDMGGNVAEWCADWYGSGYYSSSPKRNPAGPDRGEKRVVRGGSWLSGPLDTQVFRRSGRDPSTRSPTIGLRIAAGKK